MYQVLRPIPAIERWKITKVYIDLQFSIINCISDAQQSKSEKNCIFFQLAQKKNNYINDNVCDARFSNKVPRLLKMSHPYIILEYITICPTFVIFIPFGKIVLFIENKIP